jgi:hypothetical protein
MSTYSNGVACRRGWTGQRVGGRAGEQCDVTMPARNGRPRVPPAGVLEWRGEPEPCVSSRGVQASGQRHVCVGPLIPRPDLHVWDRLSRRRKLLVGTSSRRRGLLVRASSRRQGGKLSCEAESCRAKHPLVGDEMSFR